jgi:hypothetical protein
MGDAVVVTRVVGAVAAGSALSHVQQEKNGKNKVSKIFDKLF